ncbi:MAG: M23 family metallopeptidase [Thermincola sp.]|jgi:murein DD-endopeptidase MepM/ murein hydrolase activator NlpD|nr:M23 family metallopeptidase [Thermincola sp.]MDT3704365.1 M23 family metallopeptidase [Thermincola sp.]
MKINFGRGNNNNTDDLDYIYDNYRPAKSPVGFGSYPKKGAGEYKWVIQLLVSGAVLLLVAGLFRSDLPFTGTIKEGVRYLMTSETDLRPVINQVLRLSYQVGSVDWPAADNVPAPERPAITTVPPESIMLLPVSGNVLRNYGWYTDPAVKFQRFNEGIDIAVPSGTSVKASADGKVIKVSDPANLGKSILIESISGELIHYANLSQISVQIGQSVKAGDIIGKSGLADDKEPYVHFEVIVDGKPVDPLSKLGIDFTKINGAAGPEQR